VRGKLLSTEVRAALIAVLFARTAVNGGYRIVYPFLPEIARGLGVSLGVMGALLAVRSLAGLAAPLVPRLAESFGRRVVMLAGLGATITGCAILAGSNGLVPAAIGLLLAGVAKPLFDIPMQGWFGARVPYERRGRVLGLTELTWALSLAIALPAGFLIAATTWRAPFVLVVLLGAGGALAVSRLIAADRPPSTTRVPLRFTRSAVAILGVVLLFRLAAELLFVVYATWLEADFGLSVAAIGVFTLVIVGAELIGEGSVAAFADRVGLRRSILIGLVGSGIVYASLGLVGGSLPLAVLAVIGWFVLFEITIVATIPFITGIAGEARERLLSLVAAVSVAATGVAALGAPQLFALGGMMLCGLVAAAFAGAAALLLLRVPSPSVPSSTMPVPPGGQPPT
jgi:MFS transporter, DHA1 family, inner membrane transport protein